VADQVGAGDVAPDSERRIEAVTLLAEGDGRVDHVRRDGPVLEDLLLVIDIVDEAVERVDALLEAALDVVPLGGADDARDQVEGEDALGALIVAVDVEGDAELQEEPFGGVLVAEKLAGG